MSNLMSHLMATHAAIESNFAESAEDEALARRLEDFLNFVVYKKMPPSNEFDTILTQEIAEELRKDTRLLHLFKSGEGVGVKGENAFAKAIIKTVDLIQPGLLAKSNMTENIKQAIIGNTSATIVAQNLSNEMATGLQKQLEAHKSIRQYSLWNARQGKIDVDTSLVQITGEPTPLAKQLLNITASIKNYSSFKVHLEKVDRHKAYLAIVSEAYPEKDKAGLEDLYQQYQIEHINNNPIVEEHIQHLINLYALTGYGQAYINKAQGIIERKFAKFLMVNNRAEGVIKIRSTKAIVKDSIFGNKGGFAFRKTSKGKFDIHYHI